MTNHGSTKVHFNFIKNTNTLKVTIKGLQYLPKAPQPTRAIDDAPLKIYALGYNGRYLYDDKIAPYSRAIHYETAYKRLYTNIMEVDIKIQRLLLDKTSNKPLLLYIINPLTGKNLSAPIDIFDALDRAQSRSGSPISAQAELDRIDEIPLEIDLDINLGVSVSVFGYKVNLAEREL